MPPYSSESFVDTNSTYGQEDLRVAITPTPEGDQRLDKLFSALAIVTETPLTESHEVGTHRVRMATVDTINPDLSTSTLPGVLAAVVQIEGLPVCVYFDAERNSLTVRELGKEPFTLYPNKHDLISTVDTRANFSRGRKPLWLSSGDAQINFDRTNGLSISTRTPNLRLFYEPVGGPSAIPTIAPGLVGEELKRALALSETAREKSYFLRKQERLALRKNIYGASIANVAQPGRYKNANNDRIHGFDRSQIKFDHDGHFICRTILADGVAYDSSKAANPIIEHAQDTANHVELLAQAHKELLKAKEEKLLTTAIVADVVNAQYGLSCRVSTVGDSGYWVIKNGGLRTDLWKSDSVGAIRARGEDHAGKFLGYKDRAVGRIIGGNFEPENVHTDTVGLRADQRDALLLWSDGFTEALDIAFGRDQRAIEQFLLSTHRTCQSPEQFVTTVISMLRTKLANSQYVEKLDNLSLIVITPNMSTRRI